jgi:hypothetical protein
MAYIDDVSIGKSEPCSASRVYIRTAACAAIAWDRECTLLPKDFIRVEGPCDHGGSKTNPPHGAGTVRFSLTNTGRMCLRLPSAWCRHTFAPQWMIEKISMRVCETVAVCWFESVTGPKLRAALNHTKAASG